MVNYLLKSSNPDNNKLWERLRELQSSRKIPLNALIFEAIALLLESTLPDSNGSEYLEFKEQTEKRLNALESGLISQVVPSTKKRVKNRGAFILDGMVPREKAVQVIKEALKKNNSNLEVACNVLGISHSKKGLALYSSYKLEALYNYALANS